MVLKPHELDEWSCRVPISKHGVVSHFLLCVLHTTMHIKVMNCVSWEAFVKNDPHQWEVHLLENLRLSKIHNNVGNVNHLTPRAACNLQLKVLFLSGRLELVWSCLRPEQVNMWHWLMWDQSSLRVTAVRLHVRFEGINSASGTLIEKRKSATSKWASALRCAD